MSRHEQHARLIDIASRNVACLTAESSLGAAANLMAERRISSVVISQGAGSRPEGIVTERDIVRAMQSGAAPETKLYTVMSAPVVTLPQSIPCVEAYRTCQQAGIRHLVVVDDDGLLVGVVSETDFRLHLHLNALAGRRKVATVMMHAILNLPPEASLQDALNLLRAHQESCVIVVDKDMPVGILTERDVVRLYAQTQDQQAVTLRQVMVSPVKTVTIDTSINEAAEIMITARVRHLVVVDAEGRLAGIISEHDLAQTMVHSLVDTKLNSESGFLRTLIDTLPNLIWLKDTAGVYLACNQEFERFFGASEADIVGKTDYDFVDDDLANLFRKNDMAALAADHPCINEEWVTFASDGHRALLETIKTPMRDAAGNLVGILGISHDITGSRRTQEALRESEEKLRGLYELSPLGIALTDLTGHYIEFNEAFRHICGYSAEALKALDYWTLTPEKYKDQESQQLDSLLRTGRYGPYEKEYRRADGSLVPLRLNGTLLTGSDGQRYIWSIVEDISERKWIEESLVTREMQFRSLAENSPDLIFRYDRHGRRTYVNPSVERISGQTAEALLGNFPDDGAVVSRQEGRRLLQLIRNVVETAHPIEAELQITTPDGQVRHFNNRYVAEMDHHSNVISVLSVARDITERKLIEENQRLTASVFAHSREGILITDAQSRIIDVNEAFSRITGYSREEVLGKSPSLLKSGHQDREFYEAMWQSIIQNGHWSGEVWNRRKDGGFYAELLTISAVKDEFGALSHYVGIFADITHLKDHERELEKIAHYDALTGVPNRVLLADRMNQAIAQTSRNGNMMAVCYLDLDGFKPINDTFGHEAGDRLLIEMAKRMQHCLRGGDTVARIGGDEFVLLILGIEQIQECEEALSRILAAIAQPVAIADQVTASVSASLGLTLYPLDNADADTLLRHADQAMYRVKERGKNNYFIFELESS